MLRCIMPSAPNYSYLRSHFGFALNLANFLAEECGHKVHMLVPIRDENGKLLDKSVEARLNIRYFSAENHTIPQKVTVKQDKILPIDNIFIEIIGDLALMDKLKAEKFDVGIGEAFFLTAYSLAIFHILQIPATIATHSQPMWPIHLYLLGILGKMKAGNLLIGLPSIPKLANKIISNLHGHKRAEKLEEFWAICVQQTLESIKEHINQDPDYQQLASEKYGIKNFPSWDEMFRKLRFFFVNALPQIDDQFKLVERIEKVKFIGGFNLGRTSGIDLPPSPNNTSLNNLMLTNGTARGIILISFGTNVDTDEPEHSQLMEAVIGTTQNFPDFLFILKLSKGHHLPIKHANVLSATWVNQKDILDQPETKAFVSHCGMNSVYESAFHGVPMVCVPFFYDQYYNAESVARQRIALVVEREQPDIDTLKKLLIVALTKALGLEESDGSEETIDLARVKSISAAIRAHNVGKTIAEAMKVIENEKNGNAIAKRSNDLCSVQ
uniref:UDP-glucuronosyltransferase n=1 Tax=Globodera rostochiensis TaxID=31243 RepID=A0A914H4M3_GLORO